MTIIKNRGRPSWDFVSPRLKTKNRPKSLRFRRKEFFLNPQQNFKKGKKPIFFWIQIVFCRKTVKYFQWARPPERAPRAENEKTRSVLTKNKNLKPQRKMKSSISFVSEFFLPENGLVFSVPTAPIGGTKGPKKKIVLFSTKTHFLKL